MKTQNVQSHEAVLIGDAKNDVLMAQAAHVTPIVVLSGQLTRADAQKLGVHYIIPDVTHIERILTAFE